MLTPWVVSRGCVGGRGACDTRYQPSTSKRRGETEAGHRRPPQHAHGRNTSTHRTRHTAVHAHQLAASS
eukprot:scaffold1567_cov106-Isochrysis_galbana.AAC.11